MALTSADKQTALLASHAQSGCTDIIFRAVMEGKVRKLCTWQSSSAYITNVDPAHLFQERPVHDSINLTLHIFYPQR